MILTISWISDRSQTLAFDVVFDESPLENAATELSKSQKASSESDVGKTEEVLLETVLIGMVIGHTNGCGPKPSALS